MDIHFIKMFIIIELTSNVPDRLLLFRARAQFQNAFHETVNCSGRQCENCLKSLQCPCFLAFGQALSSDPSAVKRYQKPPLPFIFDMPLLPSLPNVGRTCEIGLVLVGRAVNHSKTYLASIGMMLRTAGSNGRAVGRIISVETVGYGGERHPLQETGESTAPEGLVILSAQGLQMSDDLSPIEVGVSISTPLRLMHEGRPVRELIPALFLKALMRRISSIAFYYGDIEFEADFKWLARLSNDIRWRDANFRWSEWGQSISGITGSGVLVGDLTEFHKFLLLGEHFHLGKAASFGMGRIVLGIQKDTPPDTAPIHTRL